MNYRPYGRRSIEVLSVLVALTGFMFAWAQVAKLQSREMPAAENDAPVTIRAAKRGNPYVNFDDGRELQLGANASGTQPVVLVSADFDSDGIADVVTADTTGKLQLLKGRDPAIFALDPNRKEQAKPEPFAAVSLDASLGISPDMMFAGDFNADGKQDILGLTKGASGVVVVLGDGFGHFSRPVAIPVSGSITAAGESEIGKPDGQADLAVAVTNPKGSFLLVYEHPESAFKHAPEMIKLPAPATSLTIGNMDEDFYSDIAVACGSDLVIVHERGQAYPWDVVKDSGIVRPPAVIETRRMPFSIASMAVGRFGERRGTSLAVLGRDGNIYQLEPTRKIGASYNNLPAARFANATSIPFSPTDADASKYATLGDQNLAGLAADPAGNPIVDFREIKAIGKNEYLRKRGDELAKNVKNYTPGLVEQMTLQTRAQKAEMDVRRKEAFLKSISARTSPVKEWQLATISAGSQFAAMAFRGHAELTRVKVSDSNLDDLMVTARGSSEIQFVSRQKNEDGGRRAEVSSVSASSATRAVLPVYLNLDGINDLLVLRDGSSSPTVVMSAPMSVFFVNTAADTSNCISGGECSLRGAIIAANSSPGNDIIAFGLPVGTVISPLSELPPVTTTLSIQSGAAPDGTRGVEIDGSQIVGGPADGIKLRASGCFIYGLAINRMPAVSNGNGSVTGGNGITLESTSSLPNNGGNYVVGLFLGTDATGNIARPNGATGMLIFDSDANSVGGSGASFRNVMSGNNGPAGSLGATGLAVTAGNSNNFQNNVIGLNAAGTSKLGNINGVFATGFDNNYGGDFPEQGNTISGNGKAYADDPTRCNGTGIFIATLYDTVTQEPLTLNTTLKGNRIGSDAGGTLPLGNCGAGVYTSPLHQTTIGSITETGRNIIGDNGFTAIRCVDEIYDISQLTSGGYCAIAGNNIGTDVTGTVSLPNDDRNFLGGLYRFFGNVDLYLNLSYSYFGAPGGTTPNGACTGFCNLYAGNWPANPQPGVPYAQFNLDIYTTGYSNVGIFNNSIGTTMNGSQALANLGGVATGALAGDYFLGGIGVDNGNQISLGNLISGQKQRAVWISAGFANGDCSGRGTSMLIQGNKIGTDATGTNAIRNGYDDTGSLYISDTISVNRGFADVGAIGGADPLERNIISGNAGDALNIGDACFAALPVNLPVSNNLIGLNSSLLPLGNGGNGIGVAASFVQIGGTSAAANQIAYNGSDNTSVHAGIVVLGRNSIPAVGVSIRGNPIHDNGGLGIDLGSKDPRPAFNVFIPDGVTPNDYCSQDGDAGPNALQNYPELFAPTQNMDGTVHVEGFLRSFPHGAFDIDFYSNQNPDPSGHGQGQIYIGTASIVTDGNGFGAVVFDSTSSVNATSAIAATATDTNGNTSEFSCIAGSSCNSFSGVTTLAEYIAAPQETCPASIKVNLDGDQPDANLADGFCDIDTANGDNHECTLRAALQIVTQPNYVGTHTIQFEIPGPGVHMINTTGLPAITNYVIIDGESQPGYVDKPLIEIRGTGATAGTGLELRTTGSTIKGLALNNFFDHAIYINGGSDNRIQSCFIGVAADGTTPGPDLPSSTGIYVQNSHDNTIGGSDPGARNVVARMFYGIYITGGRQNYLFNNYVGVDSTGQAARGNATGVLILGSNDNWIGKKIDVDGNVISGNSLGIQINSNSNHTIIQGNYIGTDSTGMAAIGNLSYGILVEGGATNTQIGSGLGYIAKNVIGGQNNNDRSAGILLNADAGVNNAINGNFIGVNKDASATIPNTFGVVVFSDQQTIGGGNGFPNVIGGNTDSGILVTTPAGSPNSTVDKTKIIGNHVGTNFEGTATNLGNGKIGIAMFGNVKTSTVRLNLVGNNPVGIYAGSTTDSTGPSGNKFEKNDIGLSPSGSAQSVLPNGAGLILKGASNNTLTENTISANSVFGVILGSVIDDAINQPPPGADLQTLQNKLIDNRIGTDFPGYSAFPNGKVGLVVGDFANNNCIGSCTGVGVTGGYGNVISGHNSPLGIGILLGSLSTTAPPANWPTGNQFRDNIVGMNRDLSGCLPNRIGMLVTDAGGNQIGVRVGGFKHGNVFTCNEYQGISIEGQTNGETIIESNWVGVTPTGQNFPNNTSGGIGIFYTTATKKVWIKDTVIGGQRYGVYAVQTDGNRPQPIKAGVPLPEPIVQVTSSLIGVFRDANGQLIPVGNEIGIFAENATRVLIGKLTADGTPKNIVSANTEDAIRLRGGGDNQINDTIAGTDEVGSPGLGNGGDAVAIIDSVRNLLGTDDQANARAVQNIFSGNEGKGVSVSGSVSDGNKIFGCKIGLASVNSLNVRVPNSIGIVVQDATNTLIGSGIGDSLRNFISGNNGPGVKLINTLSNYLNGNYIGTDEFGTQGLGNDGDGVVISENSEQNQVGGPGDNDGNIIAYSGGSGVRIDETAGAGNLVDPNSIFGNAGLGIDIGSAGFSPNDPDDADEGPNRGQNYPSIVNYGIDGNGHLIVTYYLDTGTAYANYDPSGIRIEFFIADGQNQGATFVAADYYTAADHDSFAAARKLRSGPSLVGGVKSVDLGDAATLGYNQGDLLTSTATDADGNTSEFSPVMAPTAAGVSISGIAKDFSGNPAKNAAVSVTSSNGVVKTALTNPFGYFEIDNVEVGETYVVTVRHKTLIFRPRIISVTDQITDISLVADP